MGPPGPFRFRDANPHGRGGLPLPQQNRLGRVPRRADQFDSGRAREVGRPVQGDLAVDGFARPGGDLAVSTPYSNLPIPDCRWRPPRRCPPAAGHRARARHRRALLRQPTADRQVRHQTERHQVLVDVRGQDVLAPVVLPDAVALAGVEERVLHLAVAVDIVPDLPLRPAHVPALGPAVFFRLLRVPRVPQGVVEHHAGRPKEAR